MSINTMVTEMDFQVFQLSVPCEEIALFLIIESESESGGGIEKIG